jgi:uncharacterized cysteine cluster protein YcgN (CxxCxxCC family)
MEMPEEDDGVDTKCAENRIISIGCRRLDRDSCQCDNSSATAFHYYPLK